MAESGDGEQPKPPALGPPAAPHPPGSSSGGGKKRVKTREQKDKHNYHCRMSRLKIKAQNKQIRDENLRMKSEQEDYIPRVQLIENTLQEMHKDVQLCFQEAKAAGSILTNFDIDGQKFSLNECSEWLASQNYGQNHQGCGSTNVAFGTDYANTSASVPIPSFVAPHSFAPQYDAPNNNIPFVLNDGFTSQFYCTYNDLSSCLPGTGFTQTDSLEAGNQNNELVNQIAHNPVAQRSAENDRDREHNLEIERLRNVEAKYQEIKRLMGELQRQFRTVGSIITQLAEESKGMNNFEPYLARKIQEVDKIVRQHVQEMPNKSFDHGSESSQAVTYTDEFVQNFIEKLEVKEKSTVDFKDFQGLEEELEKCGRFDLPHSLVLVDKLLRKYYGDITAESHQIDPIIRVSYILFCSVIKEMTQLQLEQLDTRRMIVWRDAINSGLNIGFNGSFAIGHLKKIAQAYFASTSKAQNEQELKSMEERILKLKTKLSDSEKRRENIAEMQSSEICHYHLHDFQGKPLSIGLFL